MSWKLQHAAQQLKLPLLEQHVLSKLCSYASDDGYLKYLPAREETQAGFADWASMSERSLRDTLMQLQNQGLITVPGRRSIQRIRVTIDLLNRQEVPVWELQEPAGGAGSAPGNRQEVPVQPAGGAGSAVGIKEVRTVRTHCARAQSPKRLPKQLALFEQWWDAYPKRVAIEAARRAWIKINPTPADVNAMIAAVASQCQSPEWRVENGRFIPYPARWLEEQRWHDEIKHAASVTGVPDADETDRYLRELRAGGSR